MCVMHGGTALVVASGLSVWKNSCSDFLFGSVNIEERVFLGAGSIVINNVSICKDVTIGAGGVVIHDIKEAGVYVGVPAVKK